MVEIPDIKDKDSLKAWLKDQPREVSVWIASRAAARVLPVWWNTLLRVDFARDVDLTPLPALRSLQISSVAVAVPTAHIEAAAFASANAFDANDVTNAAVTAATPLPAPPTPPTSPTPPKPPSAPPTMLLTPPMTPWLMTTTPLFGRQ